MDLPEPPEGPLGPPEPSRRSREVRETLAQQRGRARFFYEGALRTFADRSNPVRAESAAYCLRELIEELERAVVTPPPSPRLGDLVASFRAQWDAAARRDEDYGLVDHADPAVFAADEFLKAAAQGNHLRRGRAQTTFAGLDPVGIQPPPDVHEAQIAALMEFRSEFNSFLHGKESADVQAFAARMASFETFLLAWLRPRTFDDFRAIDRLISDGAANFAMGDRAESVRLVRARTANLEHFFAGLDDASWLPILLEEGFFQNPLPPMSIVTEDGQSWLQFPNWPESRYLTRIAADAPELVVAAIERIPEIANPRVHQDIVVAATSLPAELAARVALRERQWLARYDGDLVSYPQSVGALLAHLADEGQLKPALRFAATILRISAPPESASLRRRRSSGFVDDWEYGKIVTEAWPALMRAEPAKAFCFLCHRLADVIQVGYVSGTGYDTTDMWRFAIEDHTQNRRHSLLDTLVNAVRDTAVAAAARGSAGRERVLDELARHDAPIFRRLTLFLLVRHGSSERIAEALVDPVQIGSSKLWHEYAELLSARFGDLDSEQRTRILTLIAAGPNRTPTSAERDAGDARERFEEARRYWQLKRYALIEEHLDGEAAAAHQALVAEFGEPVDTTFGVDDQEVRSTSPYSTEELLTMGPSGTLKVLEAWEARRAPEDQILEALADALEAAVEQDAEGFAAIAPKFGRLTPGHVQSALDGLARAARAGSDFAWAPVLQLCKQIVVTTADSESRALGSSARLRQATIELLVSGLARAATEIPQEQRGRVWDVLSVLLEDPDPAPDRDAGTDPLTLAINTTRGQALEAAIRYGFWVERSLEAAGTFDGIHSLPELATAVERRLDLGVERSPAIRAVLGQWFVQLVRMDDDWARQLAPRIFPTAPDAAHLFAAAWNAYVIFNRPYESVFSILSDSYLLAAERFEEVDESLYMAANPRERLGEHLIHLRFLGELDLVDDGVFARFWANAPVEIRAHVVGDVGSSLEHGNAELPDDVRGRIVETWEWVLDHSDDDPRALEAFGSWFGATQLDDGWLLAQGRRVLEHRLPLTPEHVVYEALVRIAGDRPDEAVDLLRRMISASGDPWRVLGSVVRIRQTLQTVLASGSGRARSDVIAVLDILGARGLSEFRDLMPKDGSGEQ